MTIKIDVDIDNVLIAPSNDIRLCVWKNSGYEGGKDTRMMGYQKEAECASEKAKKEDENAT